MSEKYEGSLEKQIAAHERATGRPLSAEVARVSGRAIDGEPYSAEEHAPAVSQKGALNWASGNHVTSPLNPPAPAHKPTRTPRVDTGLHGVDEIVNHNGRGSK